MKPPLLPAELHAPIYTVEIAHGKQGEAHQGEQRRCLRAKRGADVGQVVDGWQVDGRERTTDKIGSGQADRTDRWQHFESKHAVLIGSSWEIGFVVQGT